MTMPLVPKPLKIPKKGIFIIFGLLLSSIYASKPPPFSQPILHTQIKDQTWIPNSITIDGLPVIRSENFSYRCLSGGLLKIHLLSGKSEVFRYPSELSYISGFARAGKYLWFSFSNKEGILRFDTKTEEFSSGPILNTLFKRKGVSEGLHLTLIQPRSDGEIWAPSYKHLDYFDPVSNQWKNMDYIYKNLDPRIVPDAHNILPINDLIWISSRQEIPGEGGMLRYNKSRNTSTLIRRELFYYNAPTTNIFDIAATSDYVFAFYTPKSPYNIQLAMYNKKTKKWQVFSKGKFFEPLRSLHKQLESICWSYPFFIPRFKEKLLKIRWSDKKLSTVYKDNELDSLIDFINKIEQKAHRLNIPFHARQFGLFEHTAFGPATFSRKKTKDGIKIAYKQLPFPGLSIEYLLALRRQLLIAVINQHVALIHLDSFNITFLPDISISNPRLVRIAVPDKQDALEIQHFDEEGYIRQIHHLNWQTKQIHKKSVFDYKSGHLGTPISSLSSLNSYDFLVTLEIDGLIIRKKLTESQAKVIQPKEPM